MSLLLLLQNGKPNNVYNEGNKNPGTIIIKRAGFCLLNLKSKTLLMPRNFDPHPIIISFNNF